ncbi:hypothetical protein ACJX0J_021000, partial [Zea mays]
LFCDIYFKCQFILKTCIRGEWIQYLLSFFYVKEKKLDEMITFPELKMKMLVSEMFENIGDSLSQGKIYGIEDVKPIDDDKGYDDNPVNDEDDFNESKDDLMSSQDLEEFAKDEDLVSEGAVGLNQM